MRGKKGKISYILVICLLFGIYGVSETYGLTGIAIIMNWILLAHLLVVVVGAMICMIFYKDTERRNILVKNNPEFLHLKTYKNNEIFWLLLVGIPIYLKCPTGLFLINLLGHVFENVYSKIILHDISSLYLIDNPRKKKEEENE